MASLIETPTKTIKLTRAKANAVVIGYGLAGKFYHCYLVKQTNVLNLYGVMAQRPEVRKQIQEDLKDVKLFATYDEVLKDNQVDLIIIATPSMTHSDLTVRALQAGKHVVCDKPLCMSLTDCETMIGAAHQRQLILTAFQNRRYDGDFMTVRKLVEEKTLGNVRWVEMAYLKGVSNSVWRQESVSNGGGRYWDLGSHLVDQFLVLFSHLAVKSVFCRMIFDLADMPGLDSHALLTIEMADGTTGLLDTNSMTAIEKPRFVVVGDIATFMKYGSDPQEDAMGKGNIDAAVEDSKLYGTMTFRDKTKTSIIVPTVAGRWKNYYENIGAVLQNKAEPLISLASVRRAVTVLEAGIISARDNKVISLQLPPCSPIGF